MMKSSDRRIKDIYLSGRVQMASRVVCLRGFLSVSEEYVIHKLVKMVKFDIFHQVR